MDHLLTDLSTLVYRAHTHASRTMRTTALLSYFILIIIDSPMIVRRDERIYGHLLREVRS